MSYHILYTVYYISTSSEYSNWLSNWSLCLAYPFCISCAHYIMEFAHIEYTTWLSNWLSNLSFDRLGYQIGSRILPLKLLAPISDLCVYAIKSDLGYSHSGYAKSVKDWKSVER